MSLRAGIWAEQVEVWFRRHQTGAGLLAIHAFDVHLHAVKALARGDEESVPIFSAEADVCGPLFRDIDVFDLFAGFVENKDAFAGDVNVSFGIDGHSVGTFFAEQGLVR